MSTAKRASTVCPAYWLGLSGVSLQQAGAHLVLQLVGRCTVQHPLRAHDADRAKLKGTLELVLLLVPQHCVCGILQVCNHPAAFALCRHRQQTLMSLPPQGKAVAGAPGP